MRTGTDSNPVIQTVFRGVPGSRGSRGTAPSEGLSIWRTRPDLGPGNVSAGICGFESHALHIYQLDSSLPWYLDGAI